MAPLTLRISTCAAGGDLVLPAPVGGRRRGGAPGGQEAMVTADQKQARVAFMWAPNAVNQLAIGSDRCSGLVSTKAED